MKTQLRKYILIFLFFLIPTGFACKFYHGPLEIWVRNYLVGILYVLFWNLVLLFCFPRRELIGRIVTVVLLVTSFLEVLQLWHPAWLEAIRSHFLGRTLLGTSFAWWDFVHYLMGSMLSVWVMEFLVRKAK